MGLIRMQVSEKSWDGGICKSCPHFDGGMHCDVRRLCGQVLACGAQRRAVVVGRYAGGGVRREPLKRQGMAKKDLPKPMKWKKTYEAFDALGKERGLVWIRRLTASQQTVARRLVRAGRIQMHFIDGAMTRGKLALFIDPKEFNNFHINKIEIEDEN